MVKFPEQPAAESLSKIRPEVHLLAAGLLLARVYPTVTDYASSWKRFRNFGPLDARFDHHLPSTKGESLVQERSILYCASNAITCIAEYFQRFRRIDRFRKSPWLVVFEIQIGCKLLDLTTTYPTRAGASIAIN